MAVFDLIRKRTNLDLDGYDLVRKAFLEKPPLLIVSTLNTDSGRSEQTGFANLLSGAYSNFRNPIAHSGNDQMSKDVVAQILIFASYLAKRIEESITPPEDK